MNEVIAKPSLFKSTAIFITFDEGGGYYDSGYVQPLTFFGDGPRVPMMVVSPYAERGYVDHTYYDHVSILKFIESNWNLPTLSARSLGNLPNPHANGADPYVPTNGPAIGDLMHLFNFNHLRTDTPWCQLYPDLMNKPGHLRSRRPSPFGFPSVPSAFQEAMGSGRVLESTRAGTSSLRTSASPTTLFVRAHLHAGLTWIIGVALPRLFPRGL